jgi:hypothetical protein
MTSLCEIVFSLCCKSSIDNFYDYSVAVTTLGMVIRHQLVYTLHVVVFSLKQILKVTHVTRRVGVPCDLDMRLIFKGTLNK